MHRFQAFIRDLYFGNGHAARLFRYGLVAFDFATVAFFFVTTVYQDAPWRLAVDFALGVLILIEFCCRLWVTTNKQRLLLSWTTAADIIVIVALLVPDIPDTWTFLRVLRATSFLRSYHVIRDLRADSPWFSANQEVVERFLRLLVFVLIVTSFVFVTQRQINADIVNFIDALYFTIATLTTTGFGDITLKGTWGRLEAIVIMIVGVTMFLQLLQAMFRPQKVRYTCSGCALTLHEPDAIHCKACGELLKIRKE